MAAELKMRRLIPLGIARMRLCLACRHPWRRASLLRDTIGAVDRGEPVLCTEAD